MASILRAEPDAALPGRDLAPSEDPPLPAPAASLWPGAARLGIDVLMLVTATALAASTASSAGASLHPWWAVLVFPPLALAVLQLRGLYVSTLNIEALDIVVPTFTAISIAAMITLVVGDVVDPDRHPVMLRLWGFAAVLVALGRIGTVIVERRLREHRIGLQPTVIVGAGAVGVRLAQRLREHAEYGLRPVAFVEDDRSGMPDRRLGVPVAGRLSDMPRVLRETGAQRVIIAFSHTRDELIAQAVRVAQQQGADVSVVPRLFDAVSERAVVEHVGGLPLLRLPPARAMSGRLLVKHAFDRLIAALALVALAPLLVLVAAAVKLSSPGPVLFRQRRVGRDGQQFALLKFRSMRAADLRATTYVPPDGQAPGGIEGEDRRTVLGRALRRSSLDEVPQLLNVVRGEMSLVGPRPERPEHVARFEREVERYADRHRMRAGLTGYAQVNNLRGQTSLDERVEWDNYYIENWSPWLDVKILSRTVAAVVRGGQGVG